MKWIEGCFLRIGESLSLNKVEPGKRHKLIVMDNVDKDGEGDSQ